MNAKLEQTGPTPAHNTRLTDAEYAAVEDILMGQLDIRRDQITPSADLEADLGADSLDRVEIVMKAEERFNVTIEDDAAGPTRTVEDLRAVLASVLGR